LGLVRGPIGKRQTFDHKPGHPIEPAKPTKIVNNPNALFVAKGQLLNRLKLPDSSDELCSWPQALIGQMNRLLSPLLVVGGCGRAGKHSPTKKLGWQT
jgi:hypothetical protein